MCRWQVKLCDSLVTHGPYLNALEIKQYTDSCVYFYFTYLRTLLLRQSLRIENSDQVAVGEC